MNTNAIAETKADAGKSPFEVEPLGARLGAEIHGLDLKRGLAAETLRAWRWHYVIRPNTVAMREVLGPFSALWDFS